MPLMVNQAFPAKYLDGAELYAFNPGPTHVTIESVSVVAMAARAPMGPPGVHVQVEQEATLLLKVREFAKPIKLKKITALSIAKALGEEDMELWFGQVISIYGIQVQAWDRMMWVVNAAEVRPPNGTKPTLPPNQLLSHLIAQKQSAQLPAAPAGPVAPPLDMRPCGQQIADRMKLRLRELKPPRTWDDFLAWLKRHHGQAFADAYGCELESVPMYVAYQLFPMFIAPPAEVIDPRTGEVLGDPDPEPDIPF